MKMLHRLLAAAVLLGICGTAQANDTPWTSVPAFDGPRAQHTATLLATGEVFLAGGDTGNRDGAGHPIALATTRLFNPATGQWRNGPNLPGPRFGHSATLLDDGTVLLVGGRAATVVAANQATLVYDPQTNAFQAVGPMALPRSHHTATRLPDGRVLAVGGRGVAGALDAVELYDPATRRWTPASALPGRRHGHTATLLQDGRVLIVGGYDTGPAPVRAAHLRMPDGTWINVPMPDHAPARAGHTATLLADGRVLLVGGSTDTASPLYSFDPAGNTWVAGVSRLGGVDVGHLDHRRGHTAIALPQGQSVLISGGMEDATGVRFSNGTLSSTQNVYTSRSRMLQARRNHTATLLPDGQVLVLGGYSDVEGTATDTAERYVHEVPGEPTHVWAQPGDGQATVHWRAPASGPVPEFYGVSTWPPSPHMIFPCRVAYPATHCTFTHLRNDVAYSFIVTAWAYGERSDASPAVVVTPSAGQAGSEELVYIPTIGLRLLVLLAAAAAGLGVLRLRRMRLPERR